MRLFILFFLALSLFAFDKNKTIKPVKIEKVTLDPVYMLPVEKYPKFQAKIVLEDGKTILFCCPKAMFDLYFRPFYYPEYKIKKESDFKKLLVKDYLTGDWIDAKRALYVFGSRLVGPKGDDLIPVKNSKLHLKMFQAKYGGTRVLTFDEVKKRGEAFIEYLDSP